MKYQPKGNNTTAKTLFGPKAIGAWPATGVSLVGPAGTTGAAGQGVPTGGTTGQVLSKVDATNYNTQWITPASGGSGDNLGNHTATQALNMANFNLTNVNTATISKLNAGDLIVGVSNIAPSTNNITSVQLNATGKTYIKVNLTNLASGYFAICGIAGGTEGKLLYLDVPFGAIWVDESSLEATPSNRLFASIMDPFVRDASVDRILITLVYLNNILGGVGRWVPLSYTF